MKRILVFLLLVFSLLPSVAYTHNGGTDLRGGHTDSSTGEYHYHHGYPAHDHYDMDGDGVVDCPYDFDDKTGENSGSSSSGSSVSKPTATPSSTAKRQISLFTTPRPTATPDQSGKTNSAADIAETVFKILFVWLPCSWILIPIGMWVYYGLKEKFKK